MMSSNINKEQVIDWLSSQSILEIRDLVRSLEEKWGVSASAPLSVSNKSSEEKGTSSDTEEKSEYDVILKDIGLRKIDVIKTVRELTELGLREAKSLVESAPQVLKEGCSKEEAHKLQKRLQDAGATVELK